MSPQFVDFDADGKLDIVAGIFDGSPHLVRGTAQGFGQPEQIRDRDGARIVLNAFWNFDTKKWDSTKRHDSAQFPAAAEGHITSALAIDLDADGDLDLLLGDHRSGRIYQRFNEGTAAQPRFSTCNEPLLVDGKPTDVPGTVATLRLVDWNRDGRLDLAVGSMGDAYQEGEGGGVFLFANTGTGKVPAFGAPITLLERSKKGRTEPTRPDSGIYMDFADHDGDGDLDMVVGGYSHWNPPKPVLTAEQEQRAAELKKEIAVLNKATSDIYQAIDKAIEGLDEAAADKKRTELFAERREEMGKLGKQRQELQKELDPLVPGAKRQSWVWLYENTATTVPPPPPR
ncbi:MAG: FG-GAP-like repeat-containing protein [Planctomycetota bacterium]